MTQQMLFLRILLLCCLPLLIPSSTLCDDAPRASPSGNAPAATELQKLVDEWNSVEVELAKEQIKLYAGGENASAEIKPRFIELLRKLGGLQQKLRDSAE